MVGIGKLVKYGKVFDGVGFTDTIQVVFESLRVTGNIKDVVELFNQFYCGFI